MSMFLPTIFMLLLVSQSAFALSPAGTRGLRNVQTAISSVQLSPELRSGPIPKEKMQTAKNLLRDLDSALSRAQGEIERMNAIDRAEPAVAEAAKKLEEYAAYRADLKKAIETATTAIASNDALFRAFREDTKSYAEVVSKFRKGPHGTLDQVKAGVAELAKLDELCRTKYPGIQDDPKLSFALNIEPGTWCSIASRREELANASIRTATAEALTKIVAQVKESKEKLSKNNGLVDVNGQPYLLLQDRAGGKALLSAKLKPLMDASGQKMPADYFAPLDEQLDGFAAEIDRLAPTWKFEASHKDQGTEAGAKKAFAEAYKGRSVIKIGMLFDSATIDKNALGVPTERYRTGALLAKGSGKWCEYRQFTAHEAYSGGGNYAPPRFTFGAVRFQSCE